MHAHHMLHDGSIVPSYAKISENGGIQQGLEVKSNFDQRYVGCDLKEIRKLGKFLCSPENVFGREH